MTVEEKLRSLCALQLMQRAAGHEREPLMYLEEAARMAYEDAAECANEAWHDDVAMKIRSRASAPGFPRLTPEGATIVAWLRKNERERSPLDGHQSAQSIFAGMFADAIEAGAHLEKP